MCIYLIEVVPVYGEEPARHGRSVERFTPVTSPPVHLSLGHSVPGGGQQGDQARGQNNWHVTDELKHVIEEI